MKKKNSIKISRIRLINKYNKQVIYNILISTMKIIIIDNNQIKVLNKINTILIF